MLCWTSELQGVAGDANRAVAKTLVDALIAIALLAYAPCILIANLVSTLLELAVEAAGATARTTSLVTKAVTKVIENLREASSIIADINNLMGDAIQVLQSVQQMGTQTGS